MENTIIIFTCILITNAIFFYLGYTHNNIKTCKEASTLLACVHMHLTKEDVVRELKELLPPDTDISGFILDFAYNELHCIFPSRDNNIFDEKTFNRMNTQIVVTAQHIKQEELNKQ